jgi:hypothetical protein
MTTYLVHDLHGVHIVYDSQELERHLKMGWKKRDEVKQEVTAEPKKLGRPKKVKA